jgi:hypothetical protein
VASAGARLEPRAPAVSRTGSGPGRCRARAPTRPLPPKAALLTDPWVDREGTLRELQPDHERPRPFRHFRQLPAGLQDFRARRTPLCPAFSVRSLNGKEGVDGSSPSEGSAKRAANRCCSGRLAPEPTCGGMRAAMELDSRRNHEDVGRGVRAVDSATNSGVARTVARGPHISELFPANQHFGQQPSNPRAEVRSLPGPPHREPLQIRCFERGAPPSHSPTRASRR